MRQINYIVLHCTAGPQSQTVADILRYWKTPKPNGCGWKTPGYHYLITPDGEAHNLQPIEKISNGVGGHNADSIHISYIGGVVSAAAGVLNTVGIPIDNRTPAQRVTMEKLVREMHDKFPSAVIQGHRDFSPDKNRNGIIEPGEWIKACPSFSVKEWLDEIGFVSSAPKPFLKTLVKVNIRAGEGTQFMPVTAPLNKGTTVKQLAKSKEWTYVLYDNVKGWIKSEYLN